MAFYDKFPYTNFQELNLDKIVHKIGDIDRAEEATAESAAAAKASEEAAAESETNAASSAASASTHASGIYNERTQIQQNKRDIHTINTRIDTLILNASETQSAEVIDIRTAAPGFTPASYNTAGEAVRGQIGYLYNTGLTYKGQLPAALGIRDFDSINITGFWYISNNNATNMDNIPRPTGGFLKVESSGSSMVQTYVTNGDVTYKRYRTSTAWTPWYQINKKLNNERIDNILPVHVHSENRPFFRAHQGAKKHAPANTLPAYKKAGQMGFDIMQIAVIRQSADGTWWVMHDDDLSLTTNGTGLLSESTDAYLSTLHINRGVNVDQYTDSELRIPKLEEVLKICFNYGMTASIRLGSLPDNISTAENLASVTSLYNLLNKFDMSKMILSVNNGTQLSMIKTNMFGETAVERYYETITDSNITNVIDTAVNGQYNNFYVLASAESWTPERIKTLHDHNILVGGWYDTANYIETGIPDMEKYQQFVEMGMDIIQTVEITYTDYKEYIDSLPI
jgi:glycerophosphoryl diester phosphodiesterase